MTVLWWLPLFGPGTPPETSKLRKLLDTTQRRERKKVAQRECSSEMAPNPTWNPHISGAKGHMGAQMGFTGSVFSM